MKLSPEMWPLTRMPAGSSKVKLAILLQLRTAISAAVQPPSDSPIRCTLPAKSIKKIEIVHGEVADVAQPRRIVGGAEARMLGHHQFAFRRDQVEERQPRRQAIGAMQENDRWPGAAFQHPDIDVPDLVFRFRPRHGIVLLGA